MKKKEKQKKMPEVPAEWLYLAAGEPVLRRLYVYLREEKKQDVQFWEEAGVLEIGLPEGGNMDLEILAEEEWDEALRFFVQEQKADQVYTVNFPEKDRKKAQILMEELVQRTGGIFCRDTEDFLPEIKRK